jgi:hypothetical protein
MQIASRGAIEGSRNEGVAFVLDLANKSGLRTGKLARHLNKVQSGAEQLSLSEEKSFRESY